MELILKRTYYPGGTNGEILLEQQHICYSIELPWRNNKHSISCIPEGRYSLDKRCSAHFGWHLKVKDVPDRVLILIHPANNAKEELQGCIAPVTKLTGIGEGLQSQAMMTKLKSLIYPQLNKDEDVFLNITASDGTEGTEGGIMKQLRWKDEDSL